MILFLLIFIQQPLPNNGQIPRYEILPLLPFAMLDAIAPLPEPDSPPRGLYYLGERLPLWLIAGVIAATAWAAGTLLFAGLPVLPLSRQERHYFAMLIGLGLVSLLTLGLGLLSLLTPLVFWPVQLAILIAAVVVNRPRPTGQVDDHFPDDRLPAGWSWRTARGWLLAASPFLCGILLGSLSPSTDFDVNEYHLGGPKEWYLAGQIRFLAHDVYTSFPFLTEMLLLDGMVLCGDWFRGGIAGQAVLMLFAPLTAWGIVLMGRRWLTLLAGLAGGFIYLSTPWVFRMSIIAYTEGALAAYGLGAVAAVLIALDGCCRTGEDASVTGRLRIHTLPAGPVILAGLCAGGAMASKYTGLVMTVVPVFLVLCLAGFRTCRQAGATWSEYGSGLFKLTLAYGLGVSILIGPWLLKNLVETGNPVYPLGYQVFGGRDLDDALAAKWANGHKRPSAGSVAGEIRDLGVKAFDVAAVNDWQSPLIFALLPVALLWRPRTCLIPLLGGMTVWLFLCWWLFTHHLDRFWTPLLPTAAALAGIGFASLAATRLKFVAVAALVAGTFFNLGFVSTGLVGYNAGLTKLSAAADLASRITGPEIAWLNAAIATGQLPADTKVLCVGEAELFHARFPYVYNTVFDHSIFEEWFGQPGEKNAAERPLKSVREIREILAAHGITHLYVNWSEILRYRQPYSYSYSDFVTPQRFRELVRLGVLEPPLTLPPGLGLQQLGDTDSDNTRLARTWAPELIVPCGEHTCLRTGEIYPVAVRPDPTP